MSDFDALLTKYADECLDPPRLCARDLIDEHPDAARTWLLEGLEGAVAGEIAKRRRKTRSDRSRNGAGQIARSDNLQPTGPIERTVADAAATAARTGKVDDLLSFSLVYQTPSGEKRLGQMTAADHKWAAGQMEQIQVASSLLAAVHRNVARLLAARPNATTESIMDEEQYRALAAKLLGTRVEALGA